MAALYVAIPDAPEIHVALTNAVWHLALPAGSACFFCTRR